MYNSTKYMFLFFVLFLALPCFGQVVINEVMYSPDQCSASHCEWIELHNPSNESVDLTQWQLCQKNLLAGYVNETDKNIYANNTMVLLPKQYAIITDGGSGTLVYSYFNISDTSLALHVDVSSLCGGLSDSGEIIILNNKSTCADFVNYNKSTGWPEAKNGNSLQKINSTGNSSDMNNWCSAIPTPGTKNNCSSPDENEPKTNNELNLNIGINKNNFDIGEEVILTGNITNSFNSTINGTLSIKFKRIDMEEYPQDWIIIEQNINIPIDVTNLSNLTNNLTWNIPENALAGEYKCYARFNLDKSSKNKTGKSYITSTAFFNYAGIGNIFIDSWNSSGLNLKINDTLNISMSITNNESKQYNVSAYLIIEKLKTATGGDSDEILYCNMAEILNNSSNIINCNWTVPHDSITQTSKIYPKIIFSIGEELIEKSGEEEKINISGLEDLGEPTFAIKTTQLSLLFNSFAVVHTEYFSGNCGQDLKFVCNGYNRKGILADFVGSKITSNYCSQNTAIQISTERGENYDVFIPIFAYPNCDQYYDTGEYALSCRICRYNKAECKWEDYSDFREETQIEISGQNECPIKTITKTYGTGNSATPTYGSYDIENVNLQKIAKRNEKINISFTLKNTESKTKICKVKSYIYSSQKIANTGGWIPNEKEIHLGAYGSKKIILENTIKEDIEEGFYNYRIRVTDWTTGKKTDSTSGIEIKGILEWNGTSSDNAKEQKSSNTGAELSCSNADEKIKVVIKNKHKEEINFTLHSFGLTEKEKTYSIKRQKTLYFNSINSDSEVFFIAEYNFDNVKKYTACSVLTNKTIETSIFNADENSFTNNLSTKQNENTITGRTIHVKKKGLIDSLVGWLKNIL